MILDKARYKVLFVAADRGYGGSSALLRSSLQHLSRDRFDPVVAYYQYTAGPEIQRIRKLGVELVFLSGAPDSLPPVPDYYVADGQAKCNRAASLLALLKRQMGSLLGEEVYELMSRLVKRSPKGLVQVLRLYRYLRRAGIDIVVLNNDITVHCVSVLAALLASVPCVCRKSGFGGLLQHRLLDRYVDCFIASSEVIAWECRQARLPMRRLVTIYEGVVLEDFAELPDGAPLRRELHIDRAAPVIGSIARIADGKGHSDLLRAARIVVAERPDVRFLIVGDDRSGGGYRLRLLQQQARDLGINHQVIFAGWRDDVPAVLAVINVSVQNPTFPEALCVSNLEAMAAGKPVVVTAAGGLAESTVDGVSGYIIPVGDADKLAAALLRLVKDPALRWRMGQNARRRASDCFDIRQTMRKTEAIFLEVLTGRPWAQAKHEVPFDVSGRSMNEMARANDLRQNAEAKPEVPSLARNDSSVDEVGLEPPCLARGRLGWKRWLRRVLLAGLWVIGLMRLWRLLHRHHVTILMVHGVMEDNGQQKWRPLRPRLSPRDLDRYLGYLARWYTFISSDEAVEMLARRAPMRPNSIVFTFDDGYRNNLSHALPILRKYGAPATIFVATGHVDHQEPFWFDRLDYALQHGLTEGREVQVGSQVVRLSAQNYSCLRDSFCRFRALAKREIVDDKRFYELMNSLSADLEANGGKALTEMCDGDDWSAVATWDQIAAASGNGIIFGSHTVNHVRLPCVSGETVRDELAESKLAIEQHVGLPCGYLAYPNGDLNEAVVATVRELGYAAAFTTREGLNKRGDDPLLLRRISLSAGLSRLELYASVSGLSDGIARAKARLLGAMEALGRTICRVLRRGSAL